MVHRSVSLRACLLAGGAMICLASPVTAQTVPIDPATVDPATSEQRVPVTETATAPTAAEADQSSSGLEDIVVTAQRRSESLQNVPISVNAVTQASLQASGVTNLDAIQAVVPGVVVAKTFAGTTPFVRGVGVIHSGFTSEVPVALYVDGVYIPNSASSVFAFNNIERIEVLKGPQGTLFGRNATGGLINIITRDPTATTTVEGQVGYGNYDTYDANLYVSGALADGLAIDFAGRYHNQRDGWGTNLVTGDEIFKNREVSVSSKLKWTIGDRTTVRLRGFYNRGRGDIGTGFGVFPGSVAVDGTVNTGKYDIGIRNPPYNRSDQYNTGLTIEHDADFARMVSITGYNFLKSEFLGNAGAPRGNLIPGQGVNNLRNNGRSWTFTQELQLQSLSGSNFQWIVGGFFMRDHFTLVSDVFPTCIDGVCNRVPPPIRSVGDQVLYSYAGFGEATLTIAENTRITAGLRYTTDDKNLSASFREPLGGFPTSLPSLPGPNRFGEPGAARPKASFSKLTWRGVISHDFAPRVMGYASVNRGFKGGAYNPTVFTNPVAEPEVLDAYEVGLKTELFNRILRFNIAGFYYEWDSIQLRTLAPPALPGQSILFNAAKAEIKGVDADMTFVPSSRLTINGSFAILDATFSEFPGGVCTAPRPIGGAVLGGASSFPCDLTGFRLQKAPKFTGTIGATYRIPTSVGNFSINASDSYNSGFFWDSDNRLRQPSYHQVNVNLNWTSSDERYSAQLYMHNLNEPNYFYAVTEAAGGTDSYTPGNPRTYGARVGFKF